jgi:sec-independent protein translocase protein TatC
VESKDLAEILLGLRRELLKIILIIIASSSIFFAFFVNPVVQKILYDLYPGEIVISNREKVAEVAMKLQNVSNVLMNYSNYPTEENRTLALASAKELVRLAMELTTSPILTSPLEGLLLNLKISLAVGIAIALPYISLVTYRTLKERTEILENVRVTKSSAFKYLVSSILLFMAGVFYGYNMMKFFIRFLYTMAISQGVTPLYSLSEFVSFVALMLVLFGLVFQLPIVMFFLVRNDIVKYETLKYYRRHIYVLFFVVGAITTPPDVFTQIMVAVPMVVFFELSLLFVRVFANPARS